MQIGLRRKAQPAVTPITVPEAPVPGLDKGAARTPRKAQTGTTYVSGNMPDDQIAQPQMEMEVGSSQPITIIEVVPELISPYQRTLAYAKMMHDAAVDVSMRVQKTPILGADFYVEPYDDTDQSKEIADFICANLFEGMAAPFLNSLEDILHFFEDGYSILEKVYELREWSPKGKGRNTKQYTMLKKLGVRPPSTIGMITYDDNGGPTSVQQFAIRGNKEVEEVELDIGEIMIFTFSRRGGDLTGRSLLRTAYSHWYYKTHFYKIDAIQKERHSLGVPRGKLGPAATDQDKKALRTLLKNLRTNEESFMILTPNVDVDFAEVHGNLVNSLESAGHHNTMILLNVMAEFMALGLQGSSGGSRATGGVQQDIFMKAVKYVGNYVAEVANMYLIPELVVWNYPTTNFPTLQVRNIGETRDLQMLGSAIANLVAQSAITMDLETENWIRDVFDMPSKSAGEEIRYPTRELIQFLQQGVGQPPTATGGAPSIPTNGATPPVPTAGGVPQKGNVGTGKGGHGSGNVPKPTGSAN